MPSLSVLDGWWIEGCIEGVTGWSIGERATAREATPEKIRESAPGGTSAAGSDNDAICLYEKLGQVVAPMFYRDRDAYLDVMRHAIALNGSFFNTHRMIQQYALKAYL